MNSSEVNKIFEQLDKAELERTKELEVIKRKFIETKDAAEVLKDQNEKVELQRRTLTEQNIRLVSTNQSLESKLASAEKTIKALKKLEITETRRNSRTKSSEVKGLENRIKELEKELKSKSTELELLKERNEELKTSDENLRLLVMKKDHEMIAKIKQKEEDHLSDLCNVQKQLEKFCVLKKLKRQKPNRASRFS